MKNNILVAITACALLFFAPSQAQPTASIAERLAAAPEGSFEAGAIQTFGAVERMFQSFYRHGIGRGFGRFIGVRSRSLANPFPEPRAPETFRTIVQTFADDLEAARTTLARSGAENAEPFVMDLSTLWLDINGNGTFDDGEAAVPLVAQLMPGRAVRGNPPDGSVEVRFDNADHAWLVAYTHVLSAGAEAVLAFDPTEVFADLQSARAALADLPEIANTFDADALRARIAELEAEQAGLQAALDARRELRRPLEEERRALMEQMRAAGSNEKREELRAEMNEIVERLNGPDFDISSLNASLRFLQRERRAALAKLPDSREARQRRMMAAQVEAFGDAGDAIYALIEVLRRQPDAGRISRVEAHWRAMLEHNRLFWRLVALETDDDREWVPNASQTGALGVTVDARTAEAWQRILDDVEAVLDGRLLIPHPLMPPGTGIDLSAWLESPSHLDPVGWIHGRAAYPYLKRGPVGTRETWFGLQSVTGGNGALFAFFLN